MELDKDTLAYGTNMIVSFTSVAYTLCVVNLRIISTIFNALKYELFFIAKLVETFVKLLISGSYSLWSH